MENVKYTLLWAFTASLLTIVEPPSLVAAETNVPSVEITVVGAYHQPIENFPLTRRLTFEKRVPRYALEVFGFEIGGSAHDWMPTHSKTHSAISGKDGVIRYPYYAKRKLKPDETRVFHDYSIDHVSRFPEYRYCPVPFSGMAVIESVKTSDRSEKIKVPSLVKNSALGNTNQLSLALRGSRLAQHASRLEITINTPVSDFIEIAKDWIRACDLECTHREESPEPLT